MNKTDLIQKLKQLEGISQDERSYLIDLVNTKKKYGLVWEDKPEDVEEQLRTHLPVLCEVTEKRLLGKDLPREIKALESKELNLFSSEENHGNQENPENHSSDSFPNHILIEGDNLHALTALTFTHEGKIDVIYIDPPYNTGNNDFIYNDSYVDKDDDFRHSKWLSFMNKRLKTAKKLLSENGIIAISIGYQELHNLVPLCEELFSSKQVVTVTVQTSGGKPSGGFNYLQEYIVFITPVEFNPNPVSFAGGISRSPFEGLTLSTFDKIQRPNQTYPIFIDKKTGGIWGCGTSLANRLKDGTYIGEIENFKFDFTEAPEGTVALWPITSKGKECVWRLISTRLMKDWKNGYIKVSPNKSSKNPNQFSVQYLPDGLIKKIKSGELIVVGTEPQHPTLVFGTNETEGNDIPTIWTEKSFFTVKGSGLLKDILKTTKFSYPKPVELICEILRATSNSDSIILDFFAGSGTTCHAAMLLNDNEGGNRQCILVTNNENNICKDVTYERLKKVSIGYSNSKNEYFEGLSSNNLRYYQCGFIDREPTLKNKREITHLATDLLCLKEDCYTEKPLDFVFTNKSDSKNIRFFEEYDKRMLVVYDDSAIETSIEIIKSIIANNQVAKDGIKVYVFSPGQYPFTEEFEEVLPYITLCALPDAIYKAFLNVLPKKKRQSIPELEEDAIESQPELFD